MKKLLSLLLAALMILSCFAGCGQAEEASSNAAVISEGSEVVSAEAEEVEESAGEEKPQEEITEVSVKEAVVEDAPSFDMALENISYPLTPENNVITSYQQLGQGIISVLPTYNGSYIDKNLTPERRFSLARNMGLKNREKAEICYIFGFVG